MKARELTLYLISNTLGYFTFFLPGTLIKNGYLSLAFIPISAILISPIAYCYYKLALRYPNGHGDKTYLQKNKVICNFYVIFSVFLILPMFCSVSTNLIVQGHFFQDNFKNNILKLVILYLLTFLNITNFDLSIEIQNILSIVRMLAFGIFILIAMLVNFNVLKSYRKPNTIKLINNFNNPKTFLRSILYSCGAFDGFNSANFISYKLTNIKNLGYAMIYSIIIEALFYILISYSIFSINTDYEDILKNYFQNIDFNFYFLDKFLIILPVLGILNGCFIVLRSILDSVSKKYSKVFLILLSHLIFYFTFYDTFKILDKLGFLINIWYFFSILALYREKKNFKVIMGMISTISLASISIYLQIDQIFKGSS